MSMAAAFNGASNWYSHFDFTDVNSNSLKVAIGLVIAFIAYGYYYTRPRESGGVYHLPGNTLLTTRAFYTRRFDFLTSHFRHHDFFRFRVLHHNVVAVSGEDARKVFFGDRYLSFEHGYMIHSGRAPSLQEIDVQKEVSAENMSLFSKVLTRVIDKSRLQDLVPILLDDVNGRMEGWGRTGRIDPFVDVYNLVFQMMARMTTCRAFSEDVVAVDRMAQLFLTLSESTTPTVILLPWFPSRDRRIRRQVTTDLYAMLSDQVNLRRKEAPSNDVIDVLISEGLDTNEIIGWIMTAMFAGVINTGIISCWILIEFAINPEWKEKCRKEALDLVTKHVGPNASGAPLHERMASIPMSAWEDEMPILDACIREAIRLYFSLAALRRNIHDDIRIGDKVIENGAFIIYDIADVNLNSDIYPKPEKFDPDRFLIRNEDAKSPKLYPFLGWGAGRHACPGMKIAKLQMKLIVALILLSFEYKLVDEKGRFPNPLPRPNRTGVHQARPAGKSCYLEYERVSA